MCVTVLLIFLDANTLDEILKKQLCVCVFALLFHTASFRRSQKNTNREIYQSIVVCTDNSTNTNENKQKKIKQGKTTKHVTTKKTKTKRHNTTAKKDREQQQNM